MLDDLADHVQLAFQLRRVQSTFPDANKHLADDGTAASGVASNFVGIHRHVAPAQQLQTFVGEDAFNQRADFPGGLRLRGQEDHANAIFSRRRKLETQSIALPAKKGVGHLQQYAGAIPGLRVAAGGPPVAQVDEHLEPLFNNLVGLAAFDVGNDANAATVVLLFRRIQALSGQFF